METDLQRSNAPLSDTTSTELHTESSKEGENLNRLDKDEPDEAISEVTSQGIFAHSTSLEDSITDDIQKLKFRDEDADDMLSRASMKSSIHELQGEEAIPIAALLEDAQPNESQHQAEKPGER